jgi:hypothetical protein
MFLPWIGLFEQIRLSDVFVHYDDVQFPQGRSFMTRVQIKSAQGTFWLTAPIDHVKSGRLINQVVFFGGTDWRGKHLATLRHIYARAPHLRLMYSIAEQIYSEQSNLLTDFNIAAIEHLAQRLRLSPKFIKSSSLGVHGTATERLIGLCMQLDCDVYVTGHGALNYLNHEKFEERGITVRYMDYKKMPYEQGAGEFTPYVSILDALAYCGERTRDLMCSDSIYWRDFLRIQNDG